MRRIIRCYWWTRFQWLRVRLYRFREIPSGLYLEKFSRGAEKLSDRIFRLVFFEADSHQYSIFSGSIYHDAPLNAMLWSMDHGPLAIVGFYLDREGVLQMSIAEEGQDITYREPSYVIRQLQGVYGLDDALKMFRWEKMLIQAVVDQAKSLGVQYVHVVKAVKNEWRHKVGCERLRLRYDVTAKRMGFKDSGCKYTLGVQS